MIEAIPKRVRIYGSAWKSYPLLCLAISVGKPIHEGEDLKTTFEMLTATGKPCLIRVSDTLQRHNLMAMGMTSDEAWDASRKMGEAWIERNAPLFKTLATPPIVVRWDNVLADPCFENTHAAFVSLAQGHGVFATALQRDMDHFLSRRTFVSREEAAIFAACSHAFLLEEVAGQTILGHHYNYARFYPGKPAEVLELVHNGEIHDAPKGLENTAFVRFQLKTAPTASNDRFVA